MAIITVRTLIVFICIYGAMRLMGKRQLGELEPSELVVAVLITDMAAHPLQDIGIPLLNGLLPIAILFSCELLISWLSLKSSRFRAFCFGRPSILMRDGRIQLVIVGCDRVARNGDSANKIGTSGVAILAKH